jgi:hypothetical protein
VSFLLWIWTVSAFRRVVEVRADGSEVGLGNVRLFTTRRRPTLRTKRRMKKKTQSQRLSKLVAKGERSLL